MGLAYQVSGTSTSRLRVQSLYMASKKGPVQIDWSRKRKPAFTDAITCIPHFQSQEQLNHCRRILAGQYSIASEDELLRHMKSLDYNALPTNMMCMLLEEISNSGYLKIASNVAFREVYVRIFNAVFASPGMSQLQFVLCVKNFYRCHFRLSKDDNLDGFYLHLRMHLYKLEDHEFPSFFIFYSALGVEMDWLPKDVAKIGRAHV